MNQDELNRPVLEKIAKDVLKMETPEQIEGFVNMFVLAMLLD